MVVISQDNWAADADDAPVDDDAAADASADDDALLMVMMRITPSFHSCHRTSLEVGDILDDGVVMQWCTLLCR